MSVNPPGLEERFLPPEGWQWGSFERLTGRELRYGFSIPASAKSMVFYLPGLAEPAEKAFETLRGILERGHGVAVMDWFGQGGSGRYLANPHKRHAGPFEDDVADLHAFLAQIATHLKGKRLIMLAHSMGGNLGLRYLCAHPETFEKAAFSAPMLNIYAVKYLPPPLALGLARGLRNWVETLYVPGGGDWNPDFKSPEEGRAHLSSDPARNSVQNLWFKAKPEIAVGGVTFGWIYEALTSCRKLRTQLSQIEIPVLLAAAGRDILVDSGATRRAADIIPDAHLLELPESLHEILMERDPIRNAFLNEFYGLI